MLLVLIFFPLVCIEILHPCLYLCEGLHDFVNGDLDAYLQTCNTIFSKTYKSSIFLTRRNQHPFTSLCLVLSYSSYSCNHRLEGIAHPTHRDLPLHHFTRRRPLTSRGTTSQLYQAVINI